MKKAFLAILATLCVSAVQAVTTNWTNWQNVTDNPDIKGTTGLSADSSAWFKQSDFAVQVTYTVAAADVAQGTYLLGYRSGNGNQFYGIRYAYNSTTTITAVQQHGIDWTIDGGNYTPTAENGMVTLTAMFVYTEGKLQAYVNGSYIGYTTFTTEDCPEAAGRYAAVTWGQQPNNANAYAMSNATISNLQYSTTQVPEPTALALLALGVAGLALKRKVA